MTPAVVPKDVARERDDRAGYERQHRAHPVQEREFFVDNLLVRIHQCFWWTGLAPWEFEFPFPGSLISTFLEWGVRVYHFRAKEGRRERLIGLSPGRPGQNLALIVLHVPHSLDSGPHTGERERDLY